MTPADIRKLVAGYASGTLSEAERKVLFEAALHDQALFDALADEEALCELLADAEVRGELLEALDEAETTLPPHVPSPLYARRAPVMQSEMPAQSAPIPAPAPAIPAGVVGRADQSRTAPGAPPPRPAASGWWRLPAYGGLVAALAVGFFLMFRPDQKHQQVALTRPAKTADQSSPPASPPFASAPQAAPEPLQQNRTIQPVPPKQQPAPAPAPAPVPVPAAPPASAVTRNEPAGAVADLSKRAAAPSGPAEAETALRTAPRPAESREQFRIVSPEPPPSQQVVTSAAAPKLPGSLSPTSAPASAPGTVAPAPPPPPPVKVAAAKAADAAPPFTTAGSFRYRVEQLGSDGNWAPAPAQLHAGNQLRLILTTPESGHIVASLGNNRTEIVEAVAGQPVTLPISSSPGTLRIGLSLQNVQAEMTPRAKRLSQARPAAGAAAAPKPSSDVEIRLEILP